jgi:outer membrane biosynthesis protein TonB
MATATKRTAKRASTKTAPVPEFSDAPEPEAGTAPATPVKAPRTARRATTKATTPAAAPKAPTGRTATKKATPAKKAAPAPAKKATPAAKKTAAPRTAKKAAPAPAPVKRTATKRTAAATRTAPKDLITTRIGPGTDDYGFLLGSDSSIAAQALVAGGADRSDINRKVEAVLSAKGGSGLKTRSGKDKVVSTVVGNVAMKMLDAGYTVASTWRLVPPQPKAKRTAVKKSA